MTFDVAVIGAGPAGAVVARHLAEATRSVVVIDECRRDRAVAEESATCAADHLHHAVAAGAVFVTARATDFDLDSHAWTIRTDVDDVGAVCARFVVDASGRGAVVATRFGANRLRARTTSAIITTVASAGASDHRRTVIEAVPDGILTSTPISGCRRVVALYVDASLALAILQKPLELQHRIRASKDVAAVVHPRASIERPVVRDAGAARLDRFVGHRWLAVGDAALSFDPLADTGLAAAVHTAARAAQAIDDAMKDRAEAFDEYIDHLEHLWAA